MGAKVFISQPLGKCTESVIKSRREKVTSDLRSKGYDIANPEWNAIDYHSDARHGKLDCLGKALQLMADCDLVYFCKGWSVARGCQIEHDAAKLYGLSMLYEV